MDICNLRSSLSLFHTVESTENIQFHDRLEMTARVCFQTRRHTPVLHKSSAAFAPGAGRVRQRGGS